MYESDNDIYYALDHIDWDISECLVSEALTDLVRLKAGLPPEEVLRSAPDWQPPQH